MKIAIVILNWNGKTLLERFLPSVIAHSEQLADIYVADNASTDDSITFLKENHPDIKIIENKENGGYAKGYNTALKEVEADLYVLLNSDVQTKTGWLEPMLDLFNDSKIGAAQPKIKDLNRPDYFEYAGAAGGYLDRLGYPFCRGRIFDICEKDEGQYDDTVEVQWASGACLFVRPKAFWEVNGLDETFFAHQEEIDLCWRMKANGWKIMACGDSEVFHLGGATLSKAHPKKTFYNFRNTLFAIVKNVSGPSAWIIILCRLILDGLAAIKFLLEGKPKHLLAILQAHLSFYKKLPLLFKKRSNLENKIPYSGIQSIVVAHFLLGKKYFSYLGIKA